MVRFDRVTTAEASHWAAAGLALQAANARGPQPKPPAVKSDRERPFFQARVQSDDGRVALWSYLADLVAVAVAPLRSR